MSLDACPQTRLGTKAPLMSIFRKQEWQEASGRAHLPTPLPPLCPHFLLDLCTPSTHPGAGCRQTGGPGRSGINRKGWPLGLQSHLKEPINEPRKGVQLHPSFGIASGQKEVSPLSQHTLSVCSPEPTAQGWGPAPRVSMPLHRGWPAWCVSRSLAGSLGT